MGAGSSVPPLPNEKTAVGLNGRSSSNVEGQAQAGESMQEVEGGVQWLLAAVGKEKEEKAWLAKRFEEKCAEVQALQKELQKVRAILDHRGSPPSQTISPQEISPTSSPSKEVAQRRGLQLTVQTAKNPPKVAFQTDKETAPITRAKSSPNMGGDGIEPMSALLRRRKEDWTPLSQAEAEGNKGLSVSTDKVFSLLGDCPASPKRVRMGSKESEPP
mmetsp:Transcript_40247/g.66375  ORF Transcript_40247/g.66375 Transcript_40247/m.66375 type:complete len:216 (+) Transcript_40247:39-686(+)